MHSGNPLIGLMVPSPVAVLMSAPEADPTLLRLRIRADVSMSPEMDETATDYEGEILLMDESFDEEEAKQIGHISYRVVPAFFDPDEENQDALFTLDELDGDALHVGESLQEHFAEAAPDGIAGLLIIDNIWIEPAYRGQGVASHAIWRVLKLFEGSAVPDHAVALLYSWDKPTSDAPWERIEEKDRAEFRHRVERLYDLFARAGFRRVGNTDVVIFPLEREVHAPSATVYMSRGA